MSQEHVGHPGASRLAAQVIDEGEDQRSGGGIGEAEAEPAPTRCLDHITDAAELIGPAAEMLRIEQRRHEEGAAGLRDGHRVIAREHRVLVRAVKDDDEALDVSAIGAVDRDPQDSTGDRNLPVRPARRQRLRSSRAGRCGGERQDDGDGCPRHAEQISQKRPTVLQ
ncbi:hypothetical protein VQ03_04605 [Methylobacterium tarhaniae]|uniref:Uncharacterized protein n=1 Tax=Methylobacterium tarhaniae TaxID=1187852 RepID=A0A0J6TE80_9HYPH|nr:hypothetical protein VQ03_04605 [Methylobacterium tarhaniae]